MERRVLGWAEGVIGMVWQELEGMVEMDGMDGMEGMDGIPCKDTTFL